MSVVKRQTSFKKAGDFIRSKALKSESFSRTAMFVFDQIYIWVWVSLSDCCIHWTCKLYTGQAGVWRSQLSGDLWSENTTLPSVDTGQTGVLWNTGRHKTGAWCQEAQRSHTEMSTASKVTLAVTTAVSLGVIWTVHSKQVGKPVQRSEMYWSSVQVEDRAKLHAGIERDLERQAKKRVVNQQLLVQQQELTKLYRQAEVTEAQGEKEA